MIQKAQETQEVQNVKDIAKAEGRKYKGKREVDAKPKVDVVIETIFPEVIKNTIYEAKKVISFEDIDNKCYNRFLDEEAVKRALRYTYPNETKDYIFSKFDGTIIEYIAESREIEIAEVLEQAKVHASINAVPSYKRTKGPRAPKNDTWA